MIKFDNEDLSRYLMFKLDKENNEFSENELDKIDEILFSPINIDGEYQEINLEIIKYFHNLKRVMFKDLTIDDDVINNLFLIKTLENLYFERCDFENTELLSNLSIKEIGFINCDIIDYSFVYKMNDIKSLAIVNGKVSLSNLNKLKKLEFLQLSNSKLIEIEKIDLPNLKELHIDNTNLLDTSNIENLPNLNRIGISEEQYKKEKDFYKNLIRKGILVLNQNLVGFDKSGE